MGLLTALAIAGVGLVVGLLSGLVGIGGGVLIVPFLYFFYDHPDLFGVLVPPDARTVLAHGTSLFIIVPTAIWGALGYHRNGLVEWRAVWPIGLVSVAAAVVGAQLAPTLPPELLKIGFGCLLVFSGARLAMQRRTPGDAVAPQEPRLSAHVTLLTGLVVGLFSALLGVGGGVVSIPLLIYWVRIELRRVAATSMGIIAITAAAGVASYVWSGLSRQDLPPLSLGFVHLPAGLAMFAGSVASVRLGATLNQRLHPRTLALLFAGLFTLIGLRLVVSNAVELARHAAAAPPAHAGEAGWG